VTQLQKELERTQTELNTANQSLKTAQDEVARLKTESPHPAPAGRSAASAPAAASKLPSREALERSYTAKAKGLKQELQGKLKEFKVDTCILYNIQMPSSEYPITSKVTVSLRSSAGESFKLDVPAKADPAGNWYFPEVNEIVQRIEEAGRSTASNRPASPQAAPQTSVAAAPQGPSRRGTGLGANRTSVIRWPESSPAAQQQTQGTAAAPQTQSTAAAPQTQSSSAPAPAPPAPAATAPSTRAASQSGGGLPANRTVVIQWPDSGKSSTGTTQRNAPGSPPNPAPSAPPRQSPADQNVLTQF
jgi:hypothetical protein